MFKRISISTKISILSVDLEMGFIGVFNVRNTDMVLKNSNNILLRAYTTIFPRIPNWSPGLKIGYNVAFLAQSICKPFNKHHQTYMMTIFVFLTPKLPDKRNFKVRILTCSFRKNRRIDLQENIF